MNIEHPNVGVSYRGDFGPKHPWLVTNREKSRRFPSGQSPGQLNTGLGVPSNSIVMYLDLPAS